MNDSIDFLDSLGPSSLQLVLSLVVILSYFALAKISSRLIKRFGKRSNIALSRVLYTTKFVRFCLFMIELLFIGLIWDIYFEGISQYLFTFFTVAGVALFASWSILSNITAAVIIFFYFPHRLGDRVRIMDGDNSVEGLVVDLNLFSIIIKNDEGQKVTYPNNMILQKAIVLLKK